MQAGLWVVWWRGWEQEGEGRRNPGPRIPQGEHLQVLTGKRTDRFKQVGSQVTVRRGSWERLPSMNPENEC